MNNNNNIDRVIQYIRTANLPRVLPCFDDGQVCSVRATRSKCVDQDEIYEGLDYIQGVLTTQAAFELDFNSLIHGKFDGKTVLKAFDKTGIEHLTVQSMDIAVPETEDIQHVIERKTDSSSLSRKSFIAHFEKWPLSREREKSQYTKDVENFMLAEERSAGLHPASLDLEYIMPVRIWRNIILRNKLSNEYKYAIKQWKQFTEDHDEHAGIMRKITEELFPRDAKIQDKVADTLWHMWQTKHLRKKGVDEWVVVSIGNNDR